MTSLSPGTKPSGSSVIEAHAPFPLKSLCKAWLSSILNNGVGGEAAIGGHSTAQRKMLSLRGLSARKTPGLPCPLRGGKELPRRVFPLRDLARLNFSLSDGWAGDGKACCIDHGRWRERVPASSTEKVRAYVFQAIRYSTS